MSKDDIVNTKLPSYEVHSATMERLLKEWGRDLRKTLPPGIGFTLFIYDYGTESDPGNMFYLSTSEREDMLKVLKEFISKQEHSK